MLLWTDALSFIDAANALTRYDELPRRSEVERYRNPRLHLVTQGIELAMKSFLRAKGWALDRLIHLGHSLTRILEACEALEMKRPSEENRRALEFLSAAHEHHEFRYGHTDRPQHMDRPDWISLAVWGLRAAIPAVAADTSPPGEVAATEKAMMKWTTQVLHPGAVWDGSTFVLPSR